MKRKYYKYTKDYMNYLILLSKYDYTSPVVLRYKSFKRTIRKYDINVFDSLLQCEKSIRELRKKEASILGDI